MPHRSRLRVAGRRGLGLLPATARAGLLRRVAARAGVAGADVGLVSVVVVVEPGDRLDDCLASIVGQTHRLLDVVVCPVGDAVVSMPDDPRLRSRPPSRTTFGAANDGLRAALGDWVTLLRGCDVLVPRAVAVLAGSLQASGSQIATGVLVQAGEAERWLVRAQADSHAEPGTQSPAGADLAADLSLANKVFCSGTARLLSFDAHDDWLCSPSLAGVLSGSSVDVVDHPVARYAHDRGRRPYGAQPSPLPGLDHWASLDTRVRETVEGTPLADGWRRHWYDVLVPRFLVDAERADDATWHRLVALAKGADGVDGLELRASSRALLRLAADGDRRGVEALAAELSHLGDDVPTELTDDGLVARWASADLPARARVLSRFETRLTTSVVRVRPSGEGSVVDVFAWIAGLDLSAHPLTATAVADGRTLDVTQGIDATADRWAGARFQSAAEGLLHVVVPDAMTSFDLTVTAGPVCRAARVDIPATPPDPSVAGLVVDDITMDGDQLVVRVQGAAEGLRLVGPTLDLHGHPLGDGRVAFDLRRELYSRGTWLPTARYRLTHVEGLSGSRAWRERLPVEMVGSHHRLRVLPLGGPADSAGELHLGPPRADDELGPYGQELLRKAYAAEDRPVDQDLFYFESYAGRSATDTPLAVFEELHTRRPDLRCVWGVLDHGQWTPPHAQVVVIGSREWYAVLGTARCLVTNTELEEWYRRRPDQLVVQCFHGYPSKAMGAAQWRARELPPRAVAVMRRRSVDTWDLISTPTPEATRLYREQYGYRGEAAERGYPRNDALTGPHASETRERTRTLLGIRRDQTAVLYAPTWRDHLAVRPRAAAMSDHLDVQQTAADLGDSHVLMVRGHRFHTPGQRAGGVVDVTDHPEINDLILASDVAVLDYSSLRFDYAITHKPMVFLVPDRVDYTGGVRGFLFPFTDTAPGPLVDDTEGVITQVRDVGALADSWRDAVAAFDAAYNPWQDGHAASRFVDQLLAAVDG